MTIANPIGYPTNNPMDTPMMHPNRPRIARIESARIESSPLKNGSPSIHIVTSVTRAESAPSVAPSPPTPVDGMDGLTIHLTDLPSLDGEVPCEVEPWSPEHPADLIIRVCCLPVAICRVGYDAAMESPLGLCRCERCGTHFRDGRTAMRIVQVLR